METFQIIKNISELRILVFLNGKFSTQSIIPWTKYDFKRSSVSLMTLYDTHFGQTQKEKNQ